MIEGHWKIPSDDYDANHKVMSHGAEVDIEYTNGWSERVVIRAGEAFRMPFSGRIVGYRSI